MNFATIWTQYILPILGGISVTSILSAIISGTLKGGFAKAIQKANLSKISDQAVEKGIERIKEISFSQSIQPIVESELKKITETANIYIEQSFNKVIQSNMRVVSILEALAKYFDNSIGVAEDAKAELRNAIELAKIDILPPQKIEVKEVYKVVEKTATNGEKTAKNTVER